MSGLERVPAVQQLGAAVLLQGHALLDVARLVSLGLQVVRQRDGIVPPPRLVELQRTLSDAVQAGSGHADMPRRAELSGWTHRWVGDMGTGEVARMLELSERQVRRLAQSAGAARRGRARVFDRASVEVLAASRSTEGM